MKRIKRSNILCFVLGGLLFGSIGVYAAGEILASQITYNKNGQATVDAALNDLYSKTPKKICTFKDNTYGTKGNVGAKYECDPGDGTKRSFYILNINKDTVDLIMDRNISENAMDWYAAMKYFELGDGKNLGWNDVSKISNPNIQEILNSVGMSSFRAAEHNDSWMCFETKSSTSSDCTNATTTTKWLWDNFEGTIVNYWTTDLIRNSSLAWRVENNGSISGGSITHVGKIGVRPVITVLKSQLN